MPEKPRVLRQQQQGSPGGPRGDPAHRPRPRARLDPLGPQRRAVSALPADLAELSSPARRPTPSGIPRPCGCGGATATPAPSSRPTAACSGSTASIAISGVPRDDGEQVLPDFDKGAVLAPFDIDPQAEVSGAAAPVQRSLAGQEARGGGNRPAVHLRQHHQHDRAAGLRRFSRTAASMPRRSARR